MQNWWESLKWGALLNDSWVWKILQKCNFHDFSINLDKSQWSDLKLVQVQLLSMSFWTTKERDMCADFIINYDYCSYELLCFWMQAESPIATAWYFHYSFLFEPLIMKWKQTESRRKRVIGISKRNISEPTSKKRQKYLCFTMKPRGTYQTVFQIYHTQIHDAHKNIKVPSIEFYIFPLSTVFLYDLCTRPASMSRVKIAATQIVCRLFKLAAEKNNSNLNLTSFVSVAFAYSHHL